MTAQEIIETLKTKASEEELHSMAKMGINTKDALGVPVKEIRILGKTLHNQELALELWASGIHEARILATYAAEKNKFDDALLEKWVSEIDSWDLCDLFCSNIACKNENGKMKMYQWAVQDEVYVKRAGFSMMATYAQGDKELTDDEIESFITLILNECEDSRTYVKKAVAWALKNIGKRNEDNRKKAVKVARVMKDTSGKTGNAIATEVLTELNSQETKSKFKPKEKRYQTRKY